MNSTEIFVFGSNLKGVHGAGAALTARQHYGAVPGLGVGRVNRSYAIPTKDWDIRSLPRTTVALYIAQFCQYATMCYKYNIPEHFKVTAVGCGLAGFEHREIAPLFSTCPPNCTFDTLWEPWLGALHGYWGTFL